MVISFVTGNEQKLSEVSAILESSGLPLPLVRVDLDLEELQSDSPEKVAAAKAALAATVTGGPVLVDDTSLCCEALDGMPGPYIKWFRRVNLSKLLAGFENKNATALSCMAFSVGPNAVPVVFTGRVDGEVVDGQGAWDRCFRPKGSRKTLGELSFDDKNKISHRAIALRKLKEYLSHSNSDDFLARLCVLDGGGGQHKTPPVPSTRFHKPNDLG